MASRRTVQRIALVSPYDFSANGGVTEHVRQLAHYLQRRNIDVTIIAPASNPSGNEPGLVSLGQVMPVPINGSVARTTLSPVVAEEVAALLARKRFDVIHLHEPFVPMLPVAVLNASPSPNVGTFHASGERSLGYAVSRKFVNWLGQRLTLRIAVSEEAARFVQRYIGGEYTIIPNGVDTEQFHPDVPPAPAWNDGRPNVLFVGRFDEPRKGFAVLFEAWAAVQQARPDARLLVVGRGNPDPLRERAEAAGYRNVHFIGPVANNDLASYYATADVFCAPSTGQESFGIVLLEAMSSGTPVVASDIAGYRQVLHHRREGLLVPPQQPKALAAALLHMLDDPSLQREAGQIGRETAQQYAWTGVTERVLEVYERAQFLRRPVSHIRETLAPVRNPQPAPPMAGISFPHELTGMGKQEEVADISSSPPRPAVLEKGGEPMLTEPLEARIRAMTQRIVGRLLGRSGISPNTITCIGFVLTLAVTYTLAIGHLALGGVLVLLTSAFDMLDGALARATDRKSAFGAFFDSTVDRYTEALILLGLLFYYERHGVMGWEIPLVYLSIVGSLMVSYTRARAEALGFDGKVGLLARPERIILLAFGLLVGWHSFAVAILAIFTNFTAAQRVYHVWRQDRRRHPRPVVPKAPRRSWFAPRDQTPS